MKKPGKSTAILVAVLLATAPLAGCDLFASDDAVDCREFCLDGPNPNYTYFDGKPADTLAECRQRITNSVLADWYSNNKCCCEKRR